MFGPVESLFLPWSAAISHSKRIKRRFYTKKFWRVSTRFRLFSQLKQWKLLRDSLQSIHKRDWLLNKSRRRSGSSRAFQLHQPRKALSRANTKKIRRTMQRLNRSAKFVRNSMGTAWTRPIIDSNYLIITWRLSPKRAAKSQCKKRLVKIESPPSHQASTTRDTTKVYHS